MLSCERTTELISASLDAKLAIYERLALKMHLLMCKLCSRCWRQMLLLSTTMHEWSKRSEEIDFMPGRSLSKDACERIKKSLREYESH
jgi:hypothetical protein